MSNNNNNNNNNNLSTSSSRAAVRRSRRVRYAPPLFSEYQAAQFVDFTPPSSISTSLTPSSPSFFSSSVSSTTNSTNSANVNRSHTDNELHDELNTILNRIRHAESVVTSLSPSTSSPPARRTRSRSRTTSITTLQSPAHVNVPFLPNPQLRAPRVRFSIAQHNSPPVNELVQAVFQGAAYGASSLPVSSSSGHRLPGLLPAPSFDFEGDLSNFLPATFNAANAPFLYSLLPYASNFIPSPADHAFAHPIPRDPRLIGHPIHSVLPSSTSADKFSSLSSASSRQSPNVSTSESSADSSRGAKRKRIVSRSTARKRGRRSSASAIVDQEQVIEVAVKFEPIEAKIDADLNALWAQFTNHISSSVATMTLSSLKLLSDSVSSSEADKKGMFRQFVRLFSDANTLGASFLHDQCKHISLRQLHHHLKNFCSPDHEFISSKVPFPCLPSEMLPVLQPSIEKLFDQVEQSAKKARAISETIDLSGIEEQPIQQNVNKVSSLNENNIEHYLDLTSENDDIDVSLDNVSSSMIVDGSVVRCRSSYAKTDFRMINCSAFLCNLPFVTSAIYEPMLEQMYHHLSILSDQMKDELVILWSHHLDTNILTQYVETCQNFINKVLLKDNVLSDRVRHGIMSLSLYHRTNEDSQRCNKKRFIDHDLFVNPTINEKFDLKQDYHIYCISRVSSNIPPVHNFNLLQFPFLFNAHNKSRILRWEIKAIQEDVQSSQNNNDYIISNAVLQIRRSHLVQDAIAQIILQRIHLSKPLRVVWAGESAVDAGGPKKEFFNELCSALFHDNYGMFRFDDTSSFYWFNIQHQLTLEAAEGKNNDIQHLLMNTHQRMEALHEYELVGAITSLAIYNDIIVPLRFPPILYAKLLDIPVDFVLFSQSFPQLGTSLQALLDYDSDDFAEVFSLNFNVHVDIFGTVINHDLIFDGQNIVVNKSNRHYFVQRYIEWICHESVSLQFEAFYRGFHSVFTERTTLLKHLFGAKELELLLCGAERLDFDKVEKSARYMGYTHNDHNPIPSSRRPKNKVVTFMWKWLKQATEQEQRQFLRFTTGTDRLPIAGAQALRLVIQRGSDDVNRLPSASTCFSTLHLPNYKSFYQLKEKFNIALHHSQGFGLR